MLKTKKTYYKREDYKYLPMETLRVICVGKQKVLSRYSYALAIASFLTLCFCGIMGWAGVFTLFYANLNVLGAGYFFTILFSFTMLLISCGIRAESKICTYICIGLFLVAAFFGAWLLIVAQSDYDYTVSAYSIIVGCVGSFVYSKVPNLFKDMEELKKIDGYPRFVRFILEKDDFERRVK